MLKWLTEINAVFTALGFTNMTLQSVFLVVFLPISVVYAMGRGLNILKTRFSKNITAIIVIVLYSVAEVLNLISEMVSNILFLSSVGVFMYVVIWQKFYSRIDSRLDAVIGKDSDQLNENGFSKSKKK